MRQETRELSHKETERLRLLERVEAEAMTLIEAAELMDVSYRQAKRLRVKLRKGGAWALAHGLRGQASNRRSDKAFRERVIARYRERYADFGLTIASEKLAGDGLTVSRETLRRWLKAEGLWLGRQTERKHRRRRRRREHFGELVQMDGSDHGWFEDRGERCCLMVMVDDATGRVHARFGPSENLQLARETLAGWIERFGGAPQALYVDRLSLYHATRSPTLDERRQGSGALTAFGQVCFGLGARLITAHSPQAKGRVERMNATLQDRLVKELRLAGVATIEAGNAFLASTFLDDLNARFGREAFSPVDFHRRLEDGMTINEALSLKATRQTQNDWSLTYGQRTLQILASPSAPRPKSRVTILERLDGTLAVRQDGRDVAFREIVNDTTRQTVQSPSPMGEGAAPAGQRTPAKGPERWGPQGLRPGPSPARGHF